MDLVHRPALVLLALSLGALASVFVAQYGFGLVPCELCLYQRVPYGVAATLAAMALWPRLGAKPVGLLLALCLVAFLTDAGLALFHVGVEQHWWTGLSGCSSGSGGAGSIDDLQALLAGPNRVVACDKVQWTLFGVSMAGYNFFACLGLAGFSGVAAWHRLRSQS